MERQLVVFLLSLLSLPIFAGDYPFEVRGVRNGVQTILVASNRGPATVSVQIDVTGENVGVNRALPVVAVVPANSELELARLFPARPGMSRYSWTTSFMSGGYEAKADPRALYRLPYLDGYTFTIGQSPGGHLTTHNSAESRDAVDITMPEGAPIVAVREGVVIRAEAGFANRGGFDPSLLDKANAIEVEHFDGTIAQYAHLRHGGVLVSPGQRVKAGDIIGYSGSTGYSGGPHLHFAIHVTRPDGHGKFARVTMPFMFFVGTPAIAFRPMEGLLATADYSSRAAVPKMKPREGQRDPFTDVLATEASKARITSSGMEQAQGEGKKIVVEISGPYVDFIAGLPGWLLYVAAVGGTLIILVLMKPGRTESSRNEPRL